MALSRLDAEKRQLQEELSRTESRSTKLELQRMSVEGDLQRLQMMLQEKDAAIAKMQEKCDQQSRSLASLEERCMSLKSTIDQLNLSLEKAATNENELRSEIQCLQRSVLEVTSNSQTTLEKLKQVCYFLTLFFTDFTFCFSCKNLYLTVKMSVVSCQNALNPLNKILRKCAAITKFFKTKFPG